MLESKKELNLFVNNSKALAIFCVLLAHCCIWKGDSQLGRSFSLVLQNIGTIGVSIFFVISGYLFDCSSSRKNSLGRFSLQKFKRVCIPWACSSIVFFLYMYLRGKSCVSILLLNIIGIKSFYWYLAITIELYFIFYFIYRCKKTYTIVFLLGILSCLYSLHVFMYGGPLFDFPLNPIRWLYFFCVGILFSFSSRNLNERVFKFVSLVCGGLFALVLFSLWSKGIVLLYKSPLYILFATLGSMFCLYMALVFAKFFSCRLLSKVGEYSFGIYLYQMFPWTGLLVAFANGLDLPILILFNPFICLMVCILELDFFRFVFSKLKKEKFISYTLGIPVK